MTPPVDILVVDDQKDQADSVDQMLDGMGCRLEFAVSGEEALAKIERRLFALVLLDVVMPGMDGFQTAQRIRAQPAARLMPIIFLTGTKPGRGAADQAYSTGAVDYLYKPVDPVLLRSKVQVLIDLFRKSRELEWERERNRMFAEMTSDYTAVFALTDGRMALQEANDALLRASGRTLDELRTLDWHTLLAPGDVPAAQEAVRGLVAGKDMRLVSRVRTPSGWRAVEVYARPVVEAGGATPARILVAAQDRTAQRQLEEELRQSQKMEAIGRLAGGVAHDFNNMLTVIIGQSTALLERLAAEEERECVVEIRDAAERSAQLTRQLLAFSRKQMLVPRVIAVNAAVEALVPMLRRMVGEDVVIELALGEAAGSVRADPSQFQQMVMNLVVNSRDAMPSGGTITIRTGAAESADARARPSLAPGRHAMLAIADTGHGMDEATRARLFEPFFTTKAPGAGTGLGLSTVHGIVSQSGGSIAVTSEPGRGTEFRIYLPAADGVERPISAAATGPVTRVGGGETVLLVEDEAAIRRLARKSLERDGYHVLEAADGAAAERIAREVGRAIDLLIADVVMPGKSGPDVHAAIRALHPHARVLYISGYADAALRGIGEAGMPFLSKPFTGQALCEKVRSVLEERS